MPGFNYVTIASLLLAGSMRASADDVALASLIADIQQQESHYDELEYVVTEHFERSQEERVNDELDSSDVLINEIRAEYSLRDGRWVYHVDELSHYLLSDSHRIYSGLWNGDAFYMHCDLVATHAANGEEKARSSRGYVWERPRNLDYAPDCGGGRFLRPHSTIVNLCPFGVPLSVWLRGHDAIDAAGFEALDEVSVHDLGDAEWQELACRHLRVETRDLKTTEDNVSWDVEIWLANERNMIPVHAVVYRDDGEQNVQLTQRTITDWREISAGVYFPMAVHEEHYDRELAEREGRYVVKSHSDWVVESVSTDCTRPAEDFESFSFPEGVEMIRR
jgi:hypothetical protein